jgi:hypothetical protein
MTDANTLLTQLHDQRMSEEYRAEVVIELEGVERRIRNMQSSMPTSPGPILSNHSFLNKTDCRVYHLVNDRKLARASAPCSMFFGSRPQFTNPRSQPTFRT